MYLVGEKNKGRYCSSLNNISIFTTVIHKLFLHKIIWNKLLDILSQVLVQFEKWKNYRKTGRQEEYARIPEPVPHTAI